MSKEIIDAEVKEIKEKMIEVPEKNYLKMSDDLEIIKYENELYEEQIDVLQNEIDSRKNGIQFRKLKANEVDARVATIGQTKDKKRTYSMWLLYKDARCDMNILDETVGSFNWKREHLRNNANCVVSIWDKEKNQWIHKEDTGAESNSEAEKGLASDSFKRACFNWGIGRELYTAPSIFIDLNEGEYYMGKNGKLQINNSTRMTVSEIGYDENGHINYLIIRDRKGNIRFTHGKKEKPATETQIKKITELYEMEDVEKMLGRLGKEALVDLSVEQASTMIAYKSK